ncbi:hypothetical protein BE20_02960 [Sorangium cellulosum]|uniref:Uncharacterized protein n=2 Tax=Sorangium TaxID=39643 RepID=A0A150S6C3_SORCE|nr:hypothetical protein BE20_02960 [Sorangium cellulosum]KYF87951.1 hypothetical protein BE18_07620 [Sorangium cellulosum]
MNGLMEIKDLSDSLRADPRFTTRRKWLILSELVYLPTREKVEEGFRYFTCPVEALTAALARRDFAAIAKLPFALDAEGDPDTSAVRLDLAYTASGALAAFQPVEFREHVPTPLSASVILEGAEAQALRETLREIDQSS